MLRFPEIWIGFKLRQSGSKFGLHLSILMFASPDQFLLKLVLSKESWVKGTEGGNEGWGAI